MLDQALHALDIIPDEDLNLMRQNQTIGELTASAISSLDQFMIKERPDLILVQGAPSISRSSTIGSGARLGYLSPAAYERRFYADRAAA
jgi:UDP-N-acetylglucosamine 2-epimerase (non-hydrolysing)